MIATLLGLVKSGIGSAAGSLLGGWQKWALIGVAVAAIAGYVGVLKLELAHRDTTIAQDATERAKLQGALDTALTANAGYKAALARVTADAAAQQTRAQTAEAALATAQASVRTKTITITKEIERAATDKDNEPVAAFPGMAAALAGILRAYGDSSDSHPPAGGGAVHPAGGS